MFPLWFVYDHTQGDFSTFSTKDEAKTLYNKLIADLNKEVGGGEYDGEERFYFGQVHERAEPLIVGFDEDNGDEIWDMVSYGMVD